MVQTHLNHPSWGALRWALALAVAAATWAAAHSAQARVVPWYLQANSQAAPASIKSEPVQPGASKITVAVIDSGVLKDHPALRGILLPGFDMVSGQRNLRGGRSAVYEPDAREASCGRQITSSSFRTHGTEVASLIAGNGYQNMWGVNPNAQILPIRVFGACGMAPNDMIDGIRWAAGLPVQGAPHNPHPARIINISIAGGTTQCRPALQEAIDQAIAKGAFVVAAAGNNFQRSLAEPANCHGVISVGAVSAENRIERYSALDPRTSIYTTGGGPALRVNRPWADNKLRVATTDTGITGAERLVVADKGVGTSFAAPLVSGFLSLWLSHRPQLRPQDWSHYITDFVRQVQPIDSCADCNPLGLVVHPKIVGAH